MPTLIRTEPETRRRRDADATRSSILDAAEAVFVKKGFAATAMTEIADRAAVTKSLIHHHYGSKKALWQEVKRRRIGVLSQIQRDVTAGGEPEAQLLAEAIRAYFRFLQAYPSFVRLSAWMNLEDPDLSVPSDSGLIDRTLEQIRAAQASGELRDDVKPWNVFVALTSICMHWFLSRHAFDHDLHADPDPDVADEEYLSDLLKIFMDGVRAQGTRGAERREV